MYANGVKRLGEAVLIQALSSAALVMKSANLPQYIKDEVEDAVAFMRGEGLYWVIETFGLGLDGDSLSNYFFYYAKRKKIKAKRETD